MNVSTQPTCRFAPSPNGRLHLGHAYSALRNAAVARRLDGRLLLRLDDLDHSRCTPALAAAMLDDLAWLGPHWAPQVRRQSEHLPRYTAALGQLAALGLLYPCFCTRGDIRHIVQARPEWPCDPDGSPLYPGTCRMLTADERARRLRLGSPHSVRLDLGRALGLAPDPLDWVEYGEGSSARRVPARPVAWGDVILRRKDIPASYHIAVVVDDAEQDVTDVVRGMDLFDATGLHRLLQALLRLPAPRYHHHRLILASDGMKLAKSRAAPALADLRRSGMTPADIERLVSEHLAVMPATTH